MSGKDLFYAPWEFSRSLNWIFTSGRYSFFDYWNRRPFRLEREDVLKIIQYNRKHFAIYLLDPKLEAWIFVKELPQGLEEKVGISSGTLGNFILGFLAKSWKSIIALYLVLAAAPLLLVPKLMQIVPDSGQLRSIIVFVALIWGAAIRVFVPPAVYFFRRKKVRSYIERAGMIQECAFWLFFGLLALPLKFELASMIYPMTTAAYWKPAEVPADCKKPVLSPSETAN